MLKTLTANLLGRGDGDESHMENEINKEEFLALEMLPEYSPEPHQLFAHKNSKVDDPRMLPFDATLDYRINEDKQPKDRRVHKLCRNLQLGSFMHRCCFTCYKYNRKVRGVHEKTCRFSFPKNWISSEAICKEIINLRNGKRRTRVEAPRNNHFLNSSMIDPLYHLGHGGNYDMQVLKGNVRGCAEYVASYALKAEQPDSQVVNNIITRLLTSRLKVTSNLTVRDKLRAVGEAMISSASVGSSQAIWFLLRQPFVVRMYLH